MKRPQGVCVDEEEEEEEGVRESVAGVNEVDTNEKEEGVPEKRK